MKLNFALLATAAFAEEDENSTGDISPYLAKLTSYCEETYGLNFYGYSLQKKNRVKARCQKQSNKLEKAYYRKSKKGDSCGSFDPGYKVEFTTIPAARDPCKALSEVTAEFNRFAITFLTNEELCGNRRTKLINKVEKWQEELQEAADCDSYLFRLRDGYTRRRISNLCKADFEDANGYDCDAYLQNGWCDLTSLSPEFYITDGVSTSHGYETGLNCPQCGCNANPPSLYDVDWQYNGTPFGEKVFALRNQRFYIDNGDHEYEIAPFRQNKQEPPRINWLGYWDGFKTVEKEGDSLYYVGGVRCAESQVTFTCGDETKVVSAIKTSDCYYEFEMTVDCSSVAGSVARKNRRTEFLPTISNSTLEE